jgi:DMSO/TMAO reductase YedYZ heme-binding membrane subunit
MKFIVSIFIIFYTYAVVRYHFGKNLDSTYFLFVFNKAIAWTASVSLGFSLFKQINNLPSRKMFGLSAFFLASLHVSLSIYLTLKNYNSSLYMNGNITIDGVTVFFSGCCSFVFMFLAFLASKWPNNFPVKWIRFGKIAFLVNFSHPIFIGIDKWLELSKWPIYLPPITLLVTLINSILFAYYW